MNPVAESLTGWTEVEALGRPLNEIFVTRDEVTGAQRPNAVELCLRENKLLHLEDGFLDNRMGDRFNLQKTVALLKEGTTVEGAILTFRDITAARQLRRELLYSATHDSLTGLPNRRYFEEKMDAVWNDLRGTDDKYVVCWMDLDRFKIINDTSGHAAGDALLQYISELLEEQTGEDEFIARLGGDEFVFLAHCDAEEGMARAKELVNLFSLIRFPWNDRVYDATISAGLVELSANSPGPDVLMGYADIACYAAKAAGRNQVSLYRPGNSEAGTYHQQVHVAADFRRAIDENRFKLYAQEICQVHGHSDYRSFEILLRLEGENGEILAPAFFIPAAERFDLMSKIDRWVIQALFVKLNSSLRRADHLRFSVNLSANALSEPSLWQFVDDELHRSKLDCGSITFEVTETSIIQNMAIARRFLTNARNAGCKVALDDFGTGLSSLSYLKHFPLDALKIDGSFIRNLVHDDLNRAIVTAITDIAHQMGALTVAECVEDRETFDLIKGMKIDLAQGWYIGKVEPLEAII
jgi:diguanylate cyclase